MKTFTVNYGNASLTEPVTLKLGVRTHEVGGVTMYYGHVLFANGVNKRTKDCSDADRVKKFVTGVAKDCKTKDFPFTDANGQRQWTDFDPNARSL